MLGYIGFITPAPLHKFEIVYNESIFLILHLLWLIFRPSKITCSETWYKWSSTSQPEAAGTTVYH